MLRSVGFEHYTRNTILMKLLRGKHFQLHTLFTNHNLDVSGIINNQLKLQLLGIDYYTGHKSLLQSLICLHPPKSRSMLPLIFGMDRDSYLPDVNNLYIFPALYSNSPGICLPIALSLDRDLTRFIKPLRENISGFSIYLRDFSDMAYIHSLVEDIGLSFPHIGGLTFKVKYPSQIVSQSSL